MNEATQANSERQGAADDPLVTVVIPTRDRPQLLRRALEGVLAQDIDGPIECLVVFDGTDPDLPDVDVPQGSTLVALRNNRKPGLAGARNTGALAARGEFVAQCDDDDEWLPGKLRAQRDALADGGSVATTGIEVRYGDQAFTRIADSPTMSFHDLLRSRRLDAHPSTFLIRRSSLLDTIGLTDEELPGGYAEDYEWLLRAARVEPVRTVQAPLTRVYWHKASYFEGRWQTVADALSSLLERYPDFADVPRGYARIAGQIAFAHSANGNRSLARTWVRRALSANWREPRAYLALAVALGVPPATVTRLAHTAGKGI